jgi:hypothetical protein
MAQLAIDFAPGLLEQFPEWMDAVRASVYRCGKPFKAIAADCDMSVSELSRRLAPQGDLPFPLDKLPRLIESTGDTLPVQWLLLSFMGDPTTASERALRDVAALAPTLIKLAQTAGLLTGTAKPRTR